MTDILTELEARLTKYEVQTTNALFRSTPTSDLRLAVDEIRALRAEVEAEEKASAHSHQMFMEVCDERDEARADVADLGRRVAEVKYERDGLKAEVERLRAELTKHGDRPCVWHAEYIKALKQAGRASRWRSLARRRREQVRDLRAERDQYREASQTNWEESLPALDLVAGRALSVLRDDLTSAHDECAKVRAELEDLSTRFVEQLRKVEERRTAVEAELEEARAINNRFMNDAEWERLDAERDAAIRERDEARETAETLHLDLAQCTVERDRARELLESTRAQAESHLQARLRAEEQLKEYEYCLSVDEVAWWKDRCEALERELGALEELYGVAGY